MNVRILRTLRALDMKDYVKAARKGEKRLGKRFCESKPEMLTIGLGSKTRNGVAAVAGVAFGGSKRPVFNVVSRLANVSCVVRLWI